MVPVFDDLRGTCANSYSGSLFSYLDASDFYSKNEACSVTSVTTVVVRQSADGRTFLL
jgi:hypothetical protein